MAHMARAAQVPAHGDPSRDPADFVATNKAMRCCYVCRLVKTERQFLETGCDNCRFLELQEDRGRVHDFTTPNFSGMITVMDPETSWATKWLHLNKYVPGAYALVITDDLPVVVQETLDNMGIKIPSQFQ